MSALTGCQVTARNTGLIGPKCNDIYSICTKEMSLLLLSGSLLFVDKTVRSYAAELWVEGLSTGRINNHRVGEILARLINMELAPLKRFTTQVYESMYKRSAFHNRQLEELLTVFISGLPDKPVTGLMTRNPITVRAESLAAEAIKSIGQNRIDDVVVLDANGVPVGLIDTQDLARLKLV